MSRLPRTFTPAELAVITRVLDMANASTPERLQEARSVLVSEMDDGGMGSLKVVRNGADPRRFGCILGEASARDSDGVPVFITVIADQFDKLYEIDIWKTDFSRLAAMPEPETLVTAK